MYIAQVSTSQNIALSELKNVPYTRLSNLKLTRSLNSIFDAKPILTEKRVSSLS